MARKRGKIFHEKGRGAKSFRQERKFKSGNAQPFQPDPRSGRKAARKAESVLVLRRGKRRGRE